MTDFPVRKLYAKFLWQNIGGTLWYPKVFRMIMTAVIDNMFIESSLTESVTMVMLNKLRTVKSNDSLVDEKDTTKIFE